MLMSLCVFCFVFVFGCLPSCPSNDAVLASQQKSSNERKIVMIVGFALYCHYCSIHTVPNVSSVGFVTLYDVDTLTMHMKIKVWLFVIRHRT